MEGRWYVYKKGARVAITESGVLEPVAFDVSHCLSAHGAFRLEGSLEARIDEWVGGCFIEPLLERGGDGRARLSYVRCICEYPESLRNQTNGTAFFMSTLFSQRHVSSCL